MIHLRATVAAPVPTLFLTVMCLAARLWTCGLWRFRWPAITAGLELLRWLRSSLLLDVHRRECAMLTMRLRLMRHPRGKSIGFSIDKPMSELELVNNM
jgi:hypothetical protein